MSKSRKVEKQEKVAALAAPQLMALRSTDLTTFFFTADIYGLSQDWYYTTLLLPNA